MVPLQKTGSSHLKLGFTPSTFCIRQQVQQRILRCLDTVFRTPYQNFSITLKVILTLSDRYKFSLVIGYELMFVAMQF